MMRNSQRFPDFNGKGLYNYFDTAREIAEYFDIPIRTARDWQARGQVPRTAKRLLDVAEAGFMPCSLGWEDFRIYNGLLYTPDGHELTPDELRMICSAFNLPQYRKVQDWLNDRHDAKVPKWLNKERGSVIVELKRG